MVNTCIFRIIDYYAYVNAHLTDNYGVGLNSMSAYLLLLLLVLV